MLFERLNNKSILLGLVIVVLSVFCSFNVWPLVKAETTDEIQSQINTKQKEIDKLEDQANAYRGVIKTKQREASSLKQQIAIYDAQIGRLEAEIVVSQTKIEQADLEIQSLNLQIEQKEQEIKLQKENISQTLRAIYEYDQENLFTILLKTDNFSDALDQMRYLELLQVQLQNKLYEITDLKMQMEEKKVEVNESRQSQQALADSLSVKQGALGQEKSGRNTLLRQTQGEESQYQSLLNNLLVKMKAFADEIKVLEQQIYNEKRYIVHLTASIPPIGAIFSWPEKNYIITQGYGMTSFAKRGAYGGEGHNGIDMSSGRGSELYAIGDGKVVAKGHNGAWGNWLAIQHTNGLVSAYGHMTSISALPVGVEVKTGKILGYEGATGYVTGAHLHLGIYHDFFTYEKNGNLYFNSLRGHINPFNYLP